MSQAPLSCADVAAQLHITRETVRDYANRGLIAGSRLPGGPKRGGRWRFQQSDVDAFLERTRQEAAS